MICFWLLDIGNNTSMEPYRAFISDRLPKSQLARGFLTQSMFTGAGAVLANLSLFLLQKVIGAGQRAGNGVPYWMYVCFMIGTVCILLTVLTAMARTKELTPSDEELAEMRCRAEGPRRTPSRTSRTPSRTMPVAMHKIGVVFLFQWYAMFIYWQFLAVSLGETIFNADPENRGRGLGPGDRLERPGERRLQLRHHDRPRCSSWAVAQRIGAKRVHAIALGLAAVSLVWLAQHQQPVRRAGPDDRHGHLLGQRGRRALR